MAGPTEPETEQTPLISAQIRRLSRLQADDIRSITSSQISREEKALKESSVGERLPYNDYTTIDWMHDLVKDSYRKRRIKHASGLRKRAIAAFDSCSGWIVAATIGSLTAVVAFGVDVAEATVSDWKEGYCKLNVLRNKDSCCLDRTPLAAGASETCSDWVEWSHSYWSAFAIYGAFALAFGIISASLTMLTKRSLPSAAPAVTHDEQNGMDSSLKGIPPPKSIYMAAGSGIPEIKTILSGFVIPHFLDLRVLLVKAAGAVFAVATGMCLGKEGPFVHISGCVGYLVAKRFTKYAENGRKMREMLSAAVAAGLSVAFGAPIGGVLFSYEEISTYFPRKTLWKAFLCSMCAAVVLRALNPNGTGKLVLFETKYGTQYLPQHYAIFVLLGVAGGLWGGLFCSLNYRWSKWFRSFPLVKNNPVLEVILVVLATVLLQYPNPLTRDPGDIIIRNLLTDCRDDDSWVCQHESDPGARGSYVAWLAYGCIVKLVLTIITFGAKVPSGVIIPALDAGALFGRLVGQSIGTISPGIFAMVGAGAFLAGVSRMTISLCVIMFELTGELEYVLPHMIAILVAKWVADMLSSESVYDLAQSVLGHPFLDLETSIHAVQTQPEAHRLKILIPPAQTMAEITVVVDKDNRVYRSTLETKLQQLKSRGLMDAGLMLVQNGVLQGYLAQGELEFCLKEIDKFHSGECGVQLLASDRTVQESDPDQHTDEEAFFGVHDDIFDLSEFVDQTPLSLCESAPIEYAIECFGKLGLRHLIVLEKGTGKAVGVVIKKRMVQYLESLH